MNCGRVIGLDLGERTIGVAISDPLQITAQPYTTLRRTSTASDIERLEKIALEHEAVAFVMGLPLRTGGEEGPEASKVREFAAELAAQTKRDIYFSDERFTTVIAEQALLQGGVSRAGRRAKIDKVAAALILQGFLDRHCS